VRRDSRAVDDVTVAAVAPAAQGSDPAAQEQPAAAAEPPAVVQSDREEVLTPVPGVAHGNAAPCGVDVLCQIVDEASAQAPLVVDEGSEVEKEADSLFGRGRRRAHLLVARIQRCPSCILRLMVRKPCRAVLVAQLLTLGLCGGLFKGGGLNTDFTSFTRASSESSLLMDAYTHAWTLSEWAPVTGTSDRRLAEATWRHSSIHIIYHKEDGSTLLDEPSLFAIQQYEHRLRNLPGWKIQCSGLTDEPGGSLMSCDPGETLLSYVWPEFLGPNARPSSELNGFGNKALGLNAVGTRYFPVSAVLPALRDEEDYYARLERLLPKDLSLSHGGTTPQSDLLQSHFLFSLSVGKPETRAVYSSKSKADDALDVFSEGELYDALTEKDPYLEAQRIKVYYHSKRLDRVDIFEALKADCRLALGGMAVVLGIFWLHTQSMVLAIFGLWLVLESIPLGYVFFKQFSGLEETGIVNCLSLFVIIGIGSDLIFVLTDGWRQSAGVLHCPGTPRSDTSTSTPKSEPATPRSTKDEIEEDLTPEEKHSREMVQRLYWLWGNSGASCATTTLCSASSFLVNLGSVLMPLREFGLFMGLCVVGAFLLQFFMYPLMLVALENMQFAKMNKAAERQAMSSSVVPCSPDGKGRDVPRTSPSGSREGATSRSILVRFFAGRWSKCIFTRKLQVLLFFTLLTIVCICGIVVNINVEGEVPDIFPDSHNQVAGKAFRNRFVKNVDISVSPERQKAWVCDITSPRKKQECRDINLSCGTWASIGMCEAKESLMNDYCSKSCGFCDFCLTRWCEVEEQPVATQTDTGQCECFEAQSSGLDDGSFAPGPIDLVTFETTVVGYSDTDWEKLQPNFTSLFVGLVEAPAAGYERLYRYSQDGTSGNYRTLAQGLDTVRAWHQPPLVQQHWRSGTTSTWPILEAPVFSVLTRPSGGDMEQPNTTRTVRQVCYCGGIPSCAATNQSRRVVQQAVGLRQERRLEEVVPSTANAPTAAAAAAPAALSPPRRLVEQTEAAAKGAKVSIIWGLKVKELGIFDLFVQTDTTQMWYWDTMFDPADPWAQRSFMRICEEITPNMRVLAPTETGGCLFKAFEKWLLTSKNEQYPSRNFHDDFRSFTLARPDYREAALLDGNTVKALHTTFILSISTKVNLQKALETKQAWEDFFDVQNLEASIRASQAWHTCSLWTTVDAQHGLISSIAIIIGISVLVGFLAMAMFTRDLKLAMLAMFSVALIVIALLFFMVGVMQWSIGAIEVVALIVFLGYMFTFNLHIAHAYKHAPLRKFDSKGKVRSGGGTGIFGLSKHYSTDASFTKNYTAHARERFHRARYSLGSVGQPLLGSAMTSTGCALFLVGCTLQFFVKFGLVILFVTILSLIYSLLFLPALLMNHGPTPYDCCWSGPRSQLPQDDGDREGSPRGSPEASLPAPDGSPPDMAGEDGEAVAGMPGGGQSVDNDGSTESLETPADLSCEAEEV